MADITRGIFNIILEMGKDVRQKKEYRAILEV